MKRIAKISLSFQIDKKSLTTAVSARDFLCGKSAALFVETEKEFHGKGKGKREKAVIEQYQKHVERHCVEYVEILRFDDVVNKGDALRFEIVKD